MTGHDEVEEKYVAWMEFSYSTSKFHRKRLILSVQTSIWLYTQMGFSFSAFPQAFTTLELSLGLIYR